MPPRRAPESCSGVGGLRSDRAGADLVEAGAAVHRAVAARCERHDRLLAAGPADRGVELARTVARSRSLRRGTARWAALWIVGQALARVEGLLAGGEGELLSAVATGQCSVLVHPLQTLQLGSDAVDGSSPSQTRWTTVRNAVERGRARDGPGRARGLLARKIRVPSRGSQHVEGLLELLVRGGVPGAVAYATPAGTNGGWPDTGADQCADLHDSRRVHHLWACLRHVGGGGSRLYRRYWRRRRPGRRRRPERSRQAGVGDEAGVRDDPAAGDGPACRTRRGPTLRNSIRARGVRPPCHITLALSSP